MNCVFIFSWHSKIRFFVWFKHGLAISRCECYRDLWPKFWFSIFIFSKLIPLDRFLNVSIRCFQNCIIFLFLAFLDSTICCPLYILFHRSLQTFEKFAICDSHFYYECIMAYMIFLRKLRNLIFDKVSQHLCNWHCPRLSANYIVVRH